MHLVHLSSGWHHNLKKFDTPNANLRDVLDI